MLLTTDALKDLVGTVALMALLSVAFGTVARAGLRPWVGRSVLGTLFGAAAVLAMRDPVLVSPGVIVDLRMLPVALAGAYAGPQGAAVAMALAVAMRVEVGGAGTLAGCAGILGAGLGGLVWPLLARKARREVGSLLGLAVMTAVPWGTVLLPADVMGTFVTQVWPILIPVHVLGVLVVASLLEREKALVEAERRLARAAERDPLTGLLNRRGFEAAAERAAGRAGRGAALLVVDLDHFKAVNDRWGHAAGDAVLRELGPRLARALRARDVVGRFGGEELVVFLPDVAPRGAEDAARRLCEVIRGRPFALPPSALPLSVPPPSPPPAVPPEPAPPAALPGGVTVTASIGGAWTGGPPDLPMLILRADAALYRAKAEGRDRCRFSGAVTGGGTEGDDEFGAHGRAEAPSPERRRAA